MSEKRCLPNKSCLTCSQVCLNTGTRILGRVPPPFLKSVPWLGPSAGCLQDNKWKMGVYECSICTSSTLSTFEKCIFNETEWTAESASLSGKCNICASQNYTMWETIEKNVDYDLVFHISGPLSNQYDCLHGYYGAFRCTGAESGSSAPRMLPKSAHQGLNWNAWGIQLKRKSRPPHQACHWLWFKVSAEQFWTWSSLKQNIWHLTSKAEPC